MQILCVGGPNDGKLIDERDDLRKGDQVSVPIARQYDPDEPVYLPWNDRRNAPIEELSIYWFDGDKLVAL